jgi:streptomycin 6-kinase
MMKINSRESLTVSNFQLSNQFITRIKNAFGVQGAAWLKELPSLVAYAERLYKLNIIEAFDHQSFNFTARAKNKNGKEFVVKICIPSIEVTQEISALKHMSGGGMVELLESDENKGIIILEKLNPGTMLSELKNDAEATKVVACVMSKLWHPISQGGDKWKTTQQWFERLEKPLNLPADFPMKLVDQAKVVANELHSDMGESVLLHGDLHHFNILSATHKPWLAIDPKGVVGERVYETGAFLRNPIPAITTSMHIKIIMTKRIEIFSEVLGFDKQRIKSWGFAQAVLAAVWSLDANSNDYRSFLVCANAMKT